MLVPLALSAADSTESVGGIDPAGCSPEPASAVPLPRPTSVPSLPGDRTAPAMRSANDDGAGSEVSESLGPAAGLSTFAWVAFSHLFSDSDCD